LIGNAGVQQAASSGFHSQAGGWRLTPSQWLSVALYNRFRGLRADHKNGNINRVVSISSSGNNNLVPGVKNKILAFLFTLENCVVIERQFCFFAVYFAQYINFFAFRKGL